MIYIFDVDNTLVQSGQPMAADMLEMFKAFQEGKECYFATGSDIAKMQKQIPVEIVQNAGGLFPVMGGEFWKDGERLYQRTFEWPVGLQEMLEDLLSQSAYPKRVGDHIQDRTSMICFSTVGKAATLEERAEYIEFENQHQEREQIAQALRTAYPQLSVTIGGQISIDISEEGNDKGQILPYLRQSYDGPITFFGDKIYQGGNDYPLAEVLEKEGAHNTVVKVESPDHTMEVLQDLIRKVA